MLSRGSWLANVPVGPMPSGGSATTSTPAGAAIPSGSGAAAHEHDAEALDQLRAERVRAGEVAEPDGVLAPEQQHGLHRTSAPAARRKPSRRLQVVLAHAVDGGQRAAREDRCRGVPRERLPARRRSDGRVAPQERVREAPLGGDRQGAGRPLAQQLGKHLPEVGGGRPGRHVLEVDQRHAIAVEQRVARVRVAVQADVGTGRVGAPAEQRREQLRGGAPGRGLRRRDRADRARQASRGQAAEGSVVWGPQPVQRGERRAEPLQPALARGRRQRVEPPPGQRLERERGAVAAQHARHAQGRGARAERRANRRGRAALARGPVARVDLRERDRAPARVEARGGRGPLGGVGDQPRGGTARSQQAVERRARARQQRQRGDPAVAGERPQHGVELGSADHARAGPVAERARVGGRGVVEAACRDVRAGVGAVDDAQALADAVLGVGPLAAARAEGARHRRAVEQRVAARDGRVGGERHRARTCVTNAASRTPAATALTTGAGTCSP